MKKQLLWLILIVVLAILSVAVWLFLNTDSSGGNPSGDIAAIGQSVSVRQERFQKTPNEYYSIDIAYPIISGLDNAAVEADLNKNIHAIAFRDYDEKEIGDYELNVTSDYSIIGGRIICCIFYEQYGHKLAAHPSRGIDYLAYDMKTGKALALSDIFTAQDKLYDLIIGEVFASVGFDVDWDELADFIGPEYLEAYLKQDYVDSQFYLRENALGIVISVPHAVGDYWDFEADYTDLWECLSPDFQILLQNSGVEPPATSSDD